MKIFVAAIPRLKERYAYVLAHLAAVSALPVEVVGVDGTALDRSDPAGDGRHNPAYPAPQIGCALSHVAACRRIVEEGLPWGVVVEDDIVLPPFADDLIRRAAATLREGEVISLYNPVMRRTEFAFESVLDPDRKLNLLVPYDMQDGRTAAAYVIENRAARGIAQGNMPVRHLADDFAAFHADGLINHFRIVDPTPCAVRPFQSSLEHFRARTLKRRITDTANKLPVIAQLVAVRRLMLRQMHSRNIVVSSRPSPLNAPNDRFRFGGNPHE